MLVAVLGLGLAVGWTATRPSSYTAGAEAFVSMRNDASGGSSAYQNNLFSQDRVKSYLRIINTPYLLDPVRQALHLNMTTEDLSARISANVPLDTVIVIITVKDGSPEQARDIANGVIEEFSKAVPRLESVSTGASPVAVTVVRHAETPGSPSSPQVGLNLALGLVVGLFMGVAVAMVRDRLDTAIKGPKDVAEATGLNPIATILADRAAERGPVVSEENSHTPRAEAFRRLRTNLQYVAVDKKPRSIVVTSARPGDGKSSTACNLAVSFAQAGRRVVLVEADLRRPSFSKYLKIEPGAGLTSVLTGAADLMDVLQPWGSDGLLVLASGPIPPNPAEILGSRGMVDLMRALNTEFDYVIIDSAPLLAVTDGAIVAAAADGVLLVAAAQQTKRGELHAALGALEAVDAAVLGVVLNRLPVKDSELYSYSYGSQLPSRTGPGSRKHRPQFMTDAAVRPSKQPSFYGPNRDGGSTVSSPTQRRGSISSEGDYREFSTMQLTPIERRSVEPDPGVDRMDPLTSEIPYRPPFYSDGHDENRR